MTGGTGVGLVGAITTTGGGGGGGGVPLGGGLRTEPATADEISTTDNTVAARPCRPVRIIGWDIQFPPRLGALNLLGLRLTHGL